MKFTAKKIYKLEANKNLTPGKGIVPATAEPIKALHCIKRPHAEVSIRTIEGQAITFPIEAFVPGAIYPYSVIQVNEAGANCFLGLSD